MSVDSNMQHREEIPRGSVAAVISIAQFRFFASSSGMNQALKQTCCRGWA